MTQVDSPPIAAQTDASPREESAHGWAAWADALGLVVAVALLLSAAGLSPVERTQEARVLVVAREMHVDGGDRWLLPRMNDQLRLQKPPLAYWLSAASFALFGVNDLAGRIPAVTSAMLLLITVRAVAASRFGRRAGWFSAAALAACLLFQRQAASAETDIHAALFGTLAAISLWRAADEKSRDLRWHALSGLMIGLGILAKGPQAATALLMLALLCVDRRSIRPALRWLISGAPLIAAGIALPWVLYVILTVGFETFRSELLIAATGGSHRGSVLSYVPFMARATLPIAAFALLSVIAAGMRSRRDAELRALLLWIASCLIPLLLIRQRQMHYLLPVLPPLAILVGWWIDACLREGGAAARLLKKLVVAHAAVALVAAIGLPLASIAMRGAPTAIDAVLIAILLSGGVLVIAAFLHGRPVMAVAAALCCMAVSLTAAQTAWIHSIVSDSLAPVAARLRELGDGPWCAYGDEQSVVLAWELRQVVRPARSIAEVQALARVHPDLIVIQKLDADEPPTTLPSFQLVGTPIVVDEHRFAIQRPGAGTPTPNTTQPASGAEKE